MTESRARIALKRKGTSFYANTVRASTAAAAGVNGVAFSLAGASHAVAGSYFYAGANAYGVLALSSATTLTNVVAVGGTGTNYYTGGSYDDASYTITLGTPLPTSSPCYVTYSYTGWLVSMSEIGAQFVGGQVDTGNVSGWTLEGC